MARPGLTQHPKFRRLIHTLQEPLPHVLGYLECMWSVAYECGNPLLGDETDVELAAQYPHTRGKLCAALLECGFLDRLEDGRFQVHDLFDHAPEYVQRRAAREARRKANGQTISGLRSAAALARWGRRAAMQTDANGRHLHPGAMQTDANGATPAPAPAPLLGEESPKNPSCSEPQAAHEPPPRPTADTDTEDPVVLVFPCCPGRKNGPREWQLRASKVREYAESFPGINVMAECRKALQWARDSHRKRKTHGGTPAFLTRWLSKAQDRGGPAPSGAPAPAAKTDAERQAEARAARADRQRRYGPNGADGEARP
jgi:hypothetical protein